MKLKVLFLSVAALFVLSAVVVPPASAQVVVNDTIWLDTRVSNGNTHGAGPVYTLNELQGLYTVTVQGTFSFWHGSEWAGDGCGAPESEPMYPSPGGDNEEVGADAAYAFAAPPGYSCTEYPAPLVSGLYPNGARVQFSVDGGSNWSHHDPDAPGYQSTHKYVYTMVGTGSFGIRLLDYPISDNYGQLQVTLHRWEQQVTGGGKINVDGSRKPHWTLAGTVGSDPNNPLAGQFQIVDHVAGVSCHFNDFSNLAFSGKIEDPTTVSPPSLYSIAEFDATGTCTDGSTPNIHVMITDNPEPQADYVQVTSSDSPISIGPAELDGGNFQVYVQP